MNRHITQTLLTVLVALLLAPAAADARIVDGPANIVRVENSDDQTLRSRARIAIDRARASDTEAGNLAFSRAHDCTGCQALSAAYQAVFVSGENTNFSPQNAGVAVNENCTGCGSFAYAYQYVLTAERKPRLSEDDRERIAALRREASDALRSGLPYPEIDAQLQDIAARFRAIIDDAVAQADVDVEDRHDTERRDDDSDD